MSKIVLLPSYQTFPTVGKSRTWHKGGLWIVADKGLVVPKTQASAAIVYLVDGNGHPVVWSTLSTALSIWLLSNGDGYLYQLTPTQVEWLRSKEKIVGDFLYAGLEVC